MFAFVEGVTVIDFLANMKIYVSYMVELYKDTIICSLSTAVPAELLLHMVQCCHASTVDEDIQALPVVIYY